MRPQGSYTIAMNQPLIMTESPVVQINREVGQQIMVASGKDAELFYVATVAAVADDRVTVRNGAEFKVRSQISMNSPPLIILPW